MSHRLLAPVILSALVSVTASQAGRIDEGTIEVGTAMSLDFEGPAGTTYKGDLQGGYFLLDGVLTGGRLGFYTDDDSSSLSAHGVLEQHFETDTPWLPYVGASLGIMYYSSDTVDAEGKTSTESDTALVLGAAGGVKFYITETAALDLSLNLAFATEDVYLADGEPDNVDIALKLGLRFFLF